MSAISKVSVVGLGRVGELVARLLRTAGFEVVGVDLTPPRDDMPFPVVVLDATDDRAIMRALESSDAVFSCLPFRFSRNLVECAVAVGAHYFDISEDVATTTRTIELAEKADTVLAPHCGLAPGLVCTTGASLTRDLDTLQSMELNVGALPRNPSGLLGYAVNWSVEGLINEYLNDCEVIRDGHRRLVPAMSELAAVRIAGTELEACMTSGGLGTMCASYEGRIQHLAYKTLRYRGHFELMRFLFDELQLRQDRELAGSILTKAKPPDDDDIVYLYAAVEGMRGGVPVRKEIVRTYRPMWIESRWWRAISWTTAASACAVVELVATRQLPDRGFIRQEDVDLEALIGTTTGQQFADLALTPELSSPILAG